MSIYTTVDKYRLFVAQDQYYQGGNKGINSYNNFLTRAFSRVFCFSMNVDFGGKVHRVNKKSYMHFLSHQGVQDISKPMLKNYKNIQQVPTRSDQGFLRHRLSAKTQSNLGRRMVAALVRQDTTEAYRLMAHGADVDKTFWTNTRNGQIHYDYAGTRFQSFMRLPSSSVHAFSATRYTPLTFAAEKAEQASFESLLTSLKSFGADASKKGFRGTFERVFKGEEKEHRDYATYHTDYHRGIGVHHSPYSRSGLGWHNTVYTTHSPGVNKVTYYTNIYDDKYTQQQTIQFDSSNNTLIATAQPDNSSEFTVSTGHTTRRVYY